MDTADYSFPAQSLKLLASASAAINSTLDVQTVLETIARCAADVMDAEASSVLVLDRRREKLTFAAAVGIHGEALKHKEFDASLGIAGSAIKKGAALNVANVSENTEFFAGIDEQIRFKTRGLMAAPMIYKSEIIGVIEVLNARNQRGFRDADLPLLETFANLAACGLRNAQAHATLRKEKLAFQQGVLPQFKMIGASAAFHEMVKLANRVAPSHATVLLVGETGTGKELLAKHIHNSSPRADKAFVAVNCAALPETLLESELFGHERGAFTGAFHQHMGRFELADEGTLFLDEIGDISASTQVKLLRLLQEKAFTRVGGTQTISCDVRVIAATNQDLKQRISQGRFRDDLFYRLNVFPIELPPLRERRDDIKSLALHFAKVAGAELGVREHRISPEALEKIAAYDWPGNIRELANVIDRAVLLCDEGEVQVSHLPAEIARGRAPEDTAREQSLWGRERAMIVAALRNSFWNQTKAAAALGISRDNLRYRVKKYNIQKEN